MKNWAWNVKTRGLTALIVLCLLSVSHSLWAEEESSKQTADAIASHVEKMVHQSGLLDIYYAEKSGKVHLKLPKKRGHYLFQSSLPRGVGSNDIGLDRGQLGDTRLISFDRHGNKVLLKQHNTKYRASANNVAEKRSIDEAFADSVIAGFKVVAENDEAILIDYTNYLLSDVHGISQRLARTNQGGYSADKSRSAVFMPRTRSFPKNTELEAVVTFTGSSPGKYVKQVTPDPNSITVHLHHSFIELPDQNYQARAFHPFSGFWEHSHYDYSTGITENMEKQVIVRHRLNKKQPEAKVSEAVEPIVYYLDPGIPEPVFSALKEGALWWNQAFTAIGYKDAFQVKVLPEDADPMDVRYNVIQWVHRATRGWSYGTSVVDPRTGELIKGHVTLGSLRVRQDYLIALGLTSPFDKEDAATDEQLAMALARIKQLSAHEVGHTLGIAHNFAASETNRASVMDYPHPKIMIKNGKLTLDNAYATGIGDWDKWVIAYGYQDYPNSANEQDQLKQVITQMHKSGIAYKSDPDSRSARYPSADGHLWDNGEDPIVEFDHLSKARSIALANFGVNTLAQGENLSKLAVRLAPIYLLPRYQLEAVAKQVGGVNYSYEQRDFSQTASGVTVVEANVQRDAIQRLLHASTAEYLRLPKHIESLIPPLAYGDQPSREDFASRAGRVFDPITAAEASAFTSLTMLLDPQRLARVSAQHSVNSELASAQDIIAGVLNTHWKNVQFKDDALASRLRQVALHAIFSVLADEQMAPEINLIIQAELARFETWLAMEAEGQGYPEFQRSVLLRHFDYFWENGKWPVSYQPQPMPPGSPI